MALGGKTGQDHLRPLCAKNIQCADNITHVLEKKNRQARYDKDDSKSN